LAVWTALERRLSTRFAREVLTVVGASVALAVAMTWPAMRHPTSTIPHDLVDSALMGWEARWGAYALWHDPGRLFDANAFYPSSHSYAFSDTLLGYWPLALFGEGASGAALSINLVYVSIFALASFGGYALARQLGAGPLGSTVAGLAVAYAPWRLAQVSHLHVISTGGIVLALAMLARGHGFSLRLPATLAEPKRMALPGGQSRGWERDGLRPERGHAGWIVGGWLVAAWQVTIGFGIGLVFVYVLAGICVAAAGLWFWRGRRPVRRAVWLSDLIGAAVFGVVSLLMARPYLQVVDEHPHARRGIDELGYYSPPLHGFLVGPAEARLWRGDPLGLGDTVLLPSEMTLLPGFTLLLLGAIGVWLSVWPRRWRIGLGVAVLLTMVLATGTRFLFGGRFTYLLLYNLPGWNGIRTPGRLVVWTTILLSLLAAGAITALAPRLMHIARTVKGWRLDLGRVIGVLAAALVVVEGLSLIHHPPVPAPPAALTAAHAQTVRPPLLVLPSDPAFDPLVMLWSTDGFPDIVNGLSGFTPESQAEIRDGTHSFPDATSIQLLRRYGVRTVVVLRERIPGTPWAGAATGSIDGLDITRTEIDTAVVYSLD
jgi:hypothetical protein